MLVPIWSALVGSLGLDSLAIAAWLYRRDRLDDRRVREEENWMQFDIPERLEETTHNDRFPIPQWEYKIVRARRDLFRDRAVLEQLCHEEAQAGWQLLEKLDDRRVRFVRSVALRHHLDDRELPFDAYRTHYGSDFDWFSVLGGAVAIVALILPAYLSFALVSQNLKTSVPVAEPLPEQLSFPRSEFP